MNIVWIIIKFILLLYSIIGIVVLISYIKDTWKENICWANWIIIFFLSLFWITVPNMSFFTIRNAWGKKSSTP